MRRNLSVAEHRSFVAANVSEGGIAAIPRRRRDDCNAQRAPVRQRRTGALRRYSFYKSNKWTAKVYNRLTHLLHRTECIVTRENIALSSVRKFQSFIQNLGSASAHTVSVKHNTAKFCLLDRMQN